MPIYAAGISFFSKTLWARFVPDKNTCLEATAPASGRRKGESQLALKHSREYNQTANCITPCRRNQSFATKGFQGFSWVSCGDKLCLRGILLPVGLINMIICCFISYIFHGKWVHFLHNKEKTFHLFFFPHDTAENSLKTSLKRAETGVKKATVWFCFKCSY